MTVDMKPRHIWGGLNICVDAATDPAAAAAARRPIRLLPICVAFSLFVVGTLTTGTCAATIPGSAPAVSSVSSLMTTPTTTTTFSNGANRNEAKGAMAVAAETSVTSFPWKQQQPKASASEEPATTTIASLPLQSEVAHRWWVDRRHENQTHREYSIFIRNSRSCRSRGSVLFYAECMCEMPVVHCM